MNYDHYDIDRDPHYRPGVVIICIIGLSIFFYLTTPYLFNSLRMVIRS